MNEVETPTQKEARQRYIDSCRDLSAASVMLKDAQHRYDRAHEQYMLAYGAAKQAGVIAV